MMTSGGPPPWGGRYWGQDDGAPATAVCACDEAGRGGPCQGSAIQGFRVEGKWDKGRPKLI